MHEPQTNNILTMRLEYDYECATAKWYRDHALDLSYAAEKVKFLIEAAPEASKARSHEGKLPIHTAILSKKNWDDIIKHIVHAYPRSLESRDPESGLYPFMLAATLCQADKNLCEPSCDHLCQPSCDDWSDDSSSCASCWESDAPPSVAAQTLNVSYMLLLACPELHKFGNWMEEDKANNPKKRPAFEACQSKCKKVA